MWFTGARLYSLSKEKAVDLKFEDVMRLVDSGDTLILYDVKRKKKHIVSLSRQGDSLSTDKGKVLLSDIVGKEYGSKVYTHKGYEYVVLPCTLHDFIMFKLERHTQIVYPKDSAYIAMRLDVKPGDTVLECGVGSGAMTAVFARLVGDNGKVVGYEKREEFASLAISNLEKMGLSSRVEVKLKDAGSGFDEKDVDAVFLDVREPWLYVGHAFSSLKAGGMLGVVVPTTNQCVEVLKELNSAMFVDVEVCEILLRKFKTVPERFRPQDRMSAHTAYLLFARKLPGG